jgi:N-acetylglucosamine kinase-like BadF-type ATPase
MEQKHPVLIADAGGTKADWRLLDAEGVITQFVSGGIQPYFQTSVEMHNTLQTSALAAIRSLPQKVYFYGAGCGSEERSEVVRILLEEFFVSAKVEVYSDIVGSARASCGHEKGIACILGTGSNACFFNGSVMVESSPSLGFWLGDEGSGAHLGKCLLQTYLRKQLSSDLATSFEKRFSKKSKDWMQIVYAHAKPNAELAGIAKWMYDQRAHPQIANMIMESFGQFLDWYVSPLVIRHNTSTIHFTGSIAFYFQSYLRKAVQSRNWQMGHILEKPIAGIALYHSTNQ